MGRYLANGFSLKKSTIANYRTKLAAVEAMLNRLPPYSTEDVSRYLTYLYLNKSGKSSGDKVRQALDWWHQTNNQPPPCNPSRPGQTSMPVMPCIENYQTLVTLLDERWRLRRKTYSFILPGTSRSKEPGDHWERNAVILALDFTTGLRIHDVLRIK